jgi:hypothetical protein
LNPGLEPGFFHQDSAHGKLQGILILSEKSTGWENSAGFAAHRRFIDENHEKLERVALVTDSLLAGMANLAVNFPMPG